jgi:hypothetical protein
VHILCLRTRRYVQRIPLPREVNWMRFDDARQRLTIEVGSSEIHVFEMGWPADATAAYPVPPSLVVDLHATLSSAGLDSSSSSAIVGPIVRRIGASVTRASLSASLSLLQPFGERWILFRDDNFRGVCCGDVCTGEAEFDIRLAHSADCIFAVHPAHTHIFAVYQHKTIMIIHLSDELTPRGLAVHRQTNSATPVDSSTLHGRFIGTHEAAMLPPSRVVYSFDPPAVDANQELFVHLHVVQ